MKKSRTRRLPVRRLSPGFVAAICLLGVATSPVAAAPIYSAWSAPVNLGPTINTTSNELAPAISPDGLSLYFDSDRPGGSGGRDIWVSQRATVSAPWGAPVNLGTIVNSGTDDANPALSTDGHWLFFAGSRPGGFGAADLYRSFRADIHDDFGWQTPTNLGPNVNTAANENGTGGYFDNAGHPQLYFGSNRPGGPGLSDIYRSNLQPDGAWGAPTLVAELSTPNQDNRPNLRNDGLEIFFYSGSGTVPDLWTAMRDSVDAPWSAPVNLGPIVNSSDADFHPYLSADATTLFFMSTRPGGVGLMDLYMTTRVQQVPEPSSIVLAVTALIGVILASALREPPSTP